MVVYLHFITYKFFPTIYGQWHVLIAQQEDDINHHQRTYTRRITYYSKASFENQLVCAFFRRMWTPPPAAVRVCANCSILTPDLKMQCTFQRWCPLLDEIVSWGNSWEGLACWWCDSRLSDIEFRAQSGTMAVYRLSGESLGGGRSQQRKLVGWRFAISEWPKA